MAEVAVRVALLARPGDARDQLRRALAELGAELVAEGDPAELDPGQVAGQSPNVVLVSLEPAIEDAIRQGFREYDFLRGGERYKYDGEIVQAAEGMGKHGLIDIRPRLDEFIFHVEPIGQHDPRVLCDLMVQETRRKLAALRMQVKAAVAKADPTQLVD